MHPRWHRHWREGCEGPPFRGRFRRSLMPKLLLILLAAGILVDICVGGFYRFSFFRNSHAAMERNVAHYARFLAGEIGSPPDTAKARALAARYCLRIAWQGSLSAWESAPGRDLPEGARFRAVTGEAGARTAWSGHRFFVRVERDGYLHTFSPDFQQAMDGKGGYLALLILVVSCVLLGAFLAIRRLLAPLKGLTAAVERIRRGELGHQVKVSSRDELGDLARSFNAMSTELHEMVRSREQLLLDVSHELRSPLTRIKVALEMAPEGTAKESIRDDLGEMEGMISEILETARLDSANGRLNLEAVDLGALLAEAVEAADLRAPGARFEAARAGSGPVVKADRARVRKVLANILDNAVKFSEGRSAPVEARISEADGAVTVRIRDRGVGIPADELPRLFEPFYRVDRSRSRETGGYGLGLSLCRRIMEAHGGSIAIESREGEGTEVTLVFPGDGALPAA